MNTDEKTRELVGIAASIAGHCQPCLKYHMHEARKLGVDRKDIRAAVALAKAIGKAGNNSMSELAAKFLGKAQE